MSTPDITVHFIDLLKKNGKLAAAMGSATSVRLTDWLTPSNIGAKKGAKYAWFYTQVKNGGPWDLKNNVYKPYKNSGVMVSGNKYDYDMPGNFHYGFVGAAAEFDDLILHKAAGVAQERAGTSKPEYHCTYGDDPKDFEFIRLGIALYDQVGLNVTEAALKSSLGQFQTIVCTP